MSLLSMLRSEQARAMYEFQEALCQKEIVDRVYFDAAAKVRRLTDRINELEEYDRNVITSCPKGGEE